MYISMTLAERAAAYRFCETCEDGEGYDVPKPMMKRLTELGLVESKGFGRYEQTELLLQMRDELKEFARVVDVLNELAVAVNTCAIGGELNADRYNVKQLMARRENAISLLAEHGL